MRFCRINRKEKGTAAVYDSHFAPFELIPWQWTNNNISFYGNIWGNKCPRSVHEPELRLTLQQSSGKARADPHYVMNITGKTVRKRAMLRANAVAISGKYTRMDGFEMVICSSLLRAVASNAPDIQS